MERDLTSLQSTNFDIIIIGGGIYGVCAAREAALRGLSVAIIEKDDFGSATSSNSLKIIHGGLRYLQHADFKRMRESITERRNLMRIAPHLVHPLPCIMPTYGHAMKGKEVMNIALFLNDLVGYDRNGLPDPKKFMPGGRVISKEECKAIIPGVDDSNLTGGAIWYDCQVHNSERLLFAMLHSAINSGAVAANYVKMTAFDIKDKRVTGVFAKDMLSGKEFKISGKLMINNTGPWFNDVLRSLNGHTPKTQIKLSVAMNLVVRKKLFPEFAVGISSKYEFKDADAVINKGSRLFFITPWKNYSVIGTTHVKYDGDPNNFRVQEKDIQQFLNDVNDAYPLAGLTREDVTFYYGGLLPMDDYNEQSGDVKLLKSYQIIDHRQENDLEGLLSVVSVKYTTARDVGEKTIDYAFHKLGLTPVKSDSAATPVFGGEIDNFEKYLAKEKSRAYGKLNPDAIEHLIANYGSQYSAVAKYIKENSGWANAVCADSPVLQAEVIYAVREEMACKLADVVRRRTELGSAGNPGAEALRTCANLMALELGWRKDKIKSEIAETEAIYVPQS